MHAKRDFDNYIHKLNIFLSDALKDWKLNIFKIIDQRISFYSQNTNMLPHKAKISYRYLKSGIEDFHRKLK